MALYENKPEYTSNLKCNQVVIITRPIETILHEL